MGVHNLWKTVDCFRIPHYGGLRTLRTRFFPANQREEQQHHQQQQPPQDVPLFPIRVGVDGNNILHAIVRQTNLVRLLINDDPEELATACVIWAKRANSAVLFGHLPKDSRQPFASFSAATQTQRQQILNNFNNPDQQWPQNSKPSNFTPPCKMNYGSDVVAAFSPSASQSSDLQNNLNEGNSLPASVFNRRLVLRELSTSGILFVFDGETPPSKVALREDRARKREQALAEASLLASYGQQDLANKILSSHPSILPKHVFAVSERLSKAGFAVLHAPYESEAQLLYLAEKKLINFVLSSDSDCIVFNPKATVLRMRSVNEFDIYDLPGFLKANPSSQKLNQATETNVNEQFSVSPTAALSFQQLQQEKMSFATQSLKTELEKKNLDDMIFKSSRELFAFCCCAAGSDYNAGVGETLPGTALSIYQNLVSQFPRFPAHFSPTSPFNDAVLSSKRFGLDLLSAHRSVANANENNNNSNEEDEIKKSLVTCRDACNRLLIPPHLALSLCTAVYVFLQHLIYDPFLEKITTFLPPEQVVDLRRYLQELMSIHNNNNNSENAFLLDSQIVGRRTPPLSSVSDREWCEGMQGAKYRACRCVVPQTNTKNNNNNNSNNAIDPLQKSSPPAGGSSHFNQAILKLQQTNKKLAMLSQNKGNNNNDVRNFSASSPTFSLFGNTFASQNVNSAMKKEGNGNVADNVLFADFDDGSNANEIHNSGIQQQQYAPSPTGFYFCQICESSFRNLAEFEVHLRGKRHEARTKLQSLMNR